MAQRVRELLDLPPRSSPSYDQWSQFYTSLAADRGCTAGRHMVYSLIMEMVLSSWPRWWLERMGLRLSDAPSCWLRGIFRRHRKAISYLEHFVVLEAFLKRDWSFQDVLRKVARFPKERPSTSSLPSQPNRLSQTVLDKRRIWQILLKQHGVKNGRLLGGGAAYAFLYRNDRAWLLRVNKRNRVKIRRKGSRVNWAQRDQGIYQRLCEINRAHALGLDAPRRSKRWFLAQVGCVTSILNHMSNLPLTATFLAVFSESIERYQVRRIRRAMQALGALGLPLKRWRILRASGLSETRLKRLARKYLKGVE